VYKDRIDGKAGSGALVARKESVLQKDALKPTADADYFRS